MIDFSTDPDAIRPYCTDESSAFSGSAERLYFPESTEQIAAVLKEATESGSGVTVSGGGTSITGARVPRGGWILAMDRMLSTPPVEGRTQVPSAEGTIWFDPETLRARVPAGLRLDTLDAAIEPLNLFYPPTLTERSAMIGGTIATNASGARSFKYGPTRDWIHGLTVVLPSGRVLCLTRDLTKARGNLLKLTDDLTIELPAVQIAQGVKNVAGYDIRPDMDAIDLFIGGEGTLGVLTEAEIQLEPRTAGAVTMLVFVSERDSALDIADQSREGLFTPWTVLAIEYFDAGALTFMRERVEDIPGAEAAVLIELVPLGLPNGSWTADATVLERWDRALSKHEIADTWVVLPTEQEQVRDFRHALPNRVNDYVRTRQGKLGTDFAVPGDQFRRLVDAYDKAANSGVKSVLFGHLGEYHLHLNFLVENDAELLKARALYVELARAAVELGGTVSAEHGIGKKRVWVDESTSIPYLELMVGGQGMDALSQLKQQLDPAWILNRDTVLPWSG